VTNRPNGGNGGNGGNGESTAIKPDLVMNPGQQSNRPVARAFESLDPCPFCDASPHDSPEGIHDVHTVRKYGGTSVGDPKWDYPHCWRCGYRPGINEAMSQKEMQRQFTAFQEWVSSEQGKVFAGQPSLDPGAQSSDMQKQLDDMKAELDKMKSSATNTPADTPSTTTKTSSKSASTSTPTDSGSSS
jgi:hypothetical protein